MKMADIANLDWIKQEHEGIYEMYPNKCLDGAEFDEVLNLLHDEGYKIYETFNKWIRAIKGV